MASIMNLIIIYVTSSTSSIFYFSGVDEINNGTISLEDNMRIDYYTSHLSFVQSAIMWVFYTIKPSKPFDYLCTI